MKTCLFPMLAMLLGLCSGCSRPRTTPLAGAPELATFTLPADDGKTLLTGVLRPATGDTLVPPAPYTAIEADSCVITCTRADKSVTAYTAAGRKIGDFELFTPCSGPYYLGVRYVGKTYYFPAVDEIITTRSSLHELELLFLRTAAGWQIRTPKGELKSTVAADSLWIIRDAKIPTKLLIGTADTGTTGSGTADSPTADSPTAGSPTADSLAAGFVLLTPDGTLHKRLSPRQWQSLKSKGTVIH